MQGPTLTLDDSPIPMAPVMAPQAISEHGAVPAQEHLQEATLDLGVGLDVPPADASESAPAVGHTQFWNNPDFGATNLNAPTGSFVQEVYVTKVPSQNAAKLVLGVFIAISCVGFGWNAFMNGEYPIDTVTHLWRMITGDTSNGLARGSKPHPNVSKSDSGDELSDDDDNDANPDTHPMVKPDQTFAHPYTYLENNIPAKIVIKKDRLHAAQENEWRAGLENPFYYQRYKTVLNVIAARKYGSEAILRDALQSGKFWMRMQAVMGLADMGYEVNSIDIKTALGDAHEELRERYLMRFEHGPCNAGCIFVVRGVMTELNASGRLQALKVLAQDHSQVTADFFVAATFDTDPRIRTYARNWLLQNPVEESDWWRVYDLVSTDSDADSNSDAATTARTSVAAVQG